MSLSVRRSIELPYPEGEQIHTTTPKSSKKHRPESLNLTPSKRAKMSQPGLDSSPLSSAPISSGESPASAKSDMDSRPVGEQSWKEPAPREDPLSLPPSPAVISARSRSPSSTPKNRKGFKNATGKRARNSCETDTNDEAESPSRSKPKSPKIITEASEPMDKREKQPRRKATPAPLPPPRERSTRQRKVPERFNVLEPSASPKVTPKASPKATPSKAGSKIYDPEYVTTNSKSRLNKVDVFHILLKDRAWTSLAPAQQHMLVSMLPADAASTALLAQLDAKIKSDDSVGVDVNLRPKIFDESDSCFRTDCAAYRRDLESGQYAKGWVAEAKKAVAERAEGKFDEWKAREVELWWGQKGNVGK